jgi:cell division protein FtsB
VPRQDDDAELQASLRVRRRTTLTGRAAVLALVVCALALSLAYPIQRFVEQQQQISELRAKVADRTGRVSALEEEQARWRDPAFVRQEARRRLHFVLPGETGYVVIGPGDTATAGWAHRSRRVGRPVMDPAMERVMDPRDRQAVAAQLGRPPRGAHAVAHRCGCGLPDVIETEPRLEDGTPFPTLYYLTCPRASAAVGRLEGSGLMREMNARLAGDRELAGSYAAAHRDYLARRCQLGRVGEIDGVSAGGMPNRVKCLHVLVGHALAVGVGVNPLGDEALALLPAYGAAGPCVAVPEGAAS